MINAATKKQVPKGLCLLITGINGIHIPLLTLSLNITNENWLYRTKYRQFVGLNMNLLN